jgi:hypothetical protein
MSAARAYIDGLAASGRYHFTTGEARNALGGSLPAVRATLRRLKRRGETADTHRGLHVWCLPNSFASVACRRSSSFRS